MAVIDWTQSYQPRMEERAKLGLKPEESAERQEGLRGLAGRSQNAVISDGISMLDQALQLRPDYDDAMAYMNLMYREKADLAVRRSLPRNAADLKTADEWVDKTMATKKAKAGKAAGQPGTHYRKPEVNFLKMDS